MHGIKLGSYELVRKLGEGGMGAVYLAVHHLIGRKAAVKVLLPELSQNKEVVERFFNEARAATLVQHAGIVDVFDFGISDEGGAYLVMEYLEGEPLSARMARRGKMPEAETLRLARQAASALAAAHREGIIHRDLKPDNVIVVPDSEVPGGERVKILDFGIAKLTGEGAENARKTRTGTIMGTPYYMAPEQCAGAGAELDARVDVYALGCVMYEMLCAAPPFDGSGIGEVIAKHIYEAPPSPRDLAPHVSEATTSLVMTCLAKDAGERFASMDALLSAVDTLRENRDSEVPNTSLAMANTVTDGADEAPPANAAAPSEPHASDESVGSVGEAGPTTLEAASGQVTQRKSTGVGAATRRRPLAILGVSALAAITALGGALILVSDRGMASGEDAAAVRAPLGEAPAADAALAEHAPGARGPEQPKVRFAITSEPRGALVQDPDEAILGVTPLELEVAKDGDPVVYFVRAPDYEDARVELVADRDREKTITLKRHGASPPAEKAVGREHAPRDPSPGAPRPTPSEDREASGDRRAEEGAGRPRETEAEDEDPFGSRR